MSWPRGVCRRPDQLRSVAAMMSSGMRQSEVADTLGISRAAVCKFVRRWSIAADDVVLETRRCLSCQQAFGSTGRGNRICVACATANRDVVA